MIVEDNVEVQGFLQQLLAPDYEVLTFDDGQAALDFLSANKNKSLPVDLILSDINMPRLDGYGLVEALKKEEQWQQIPLIMLTARTKERSKLQALRMGVDDYLTKPFSPIELKVRIENILGNYQKRIAFQKDYLKVNPQFEVSPSADQVWLKDLETYALEALEKRIDLTAGHLAVQLNIGERQLARKVKLLTGLTIGKYITEVKLQKARHLVEERSYSTIAEIGYASGFRSPSYFTKVFTDYFGKTPTAYQ
jgi:DNA-binding response OmpR family regulator